MAKYELSNSAVADLSNIWDYTFEAWSEKQADKYYNILIETCNKIAQAPDIGKTYDPIGPDILGFRINRHIIFYRVAVNGIIILRILHQQMDLKSRISE